MRKFRRVDLRKFQFPLRQLAQDFFRDGRCDAGGAVVYKFDDFRNVGNLEKLRRASK